MFSHFRVDLIKNGNKYKLHPLVTSCPFSSTTTTTPTPFNHSPQKYLGLPFWHPKGDSVYWRPKTGENSQNKHASNEPVLSRAIVKLPSCSLYIPAILIDWDFTLPKPYSLSNKLCWSNKPNGIDQESLKRVWNPIHAYCTTYKSLNSINTWNSFVPLGFIVEGYIWTSERQQGFIQPPLLHAKSSRPLMESLYFMIKLHDPYSTSYDIVNPRQ